MNTDRIENENHLHYEDQRAEVKHGSLCGDFVFSQQREQSEKERKERDCIVRVTTGRGSLYVVYSFGGSLCRFRLF